MAPPHSDFALFPGSVTMQETAGDAGLLKMALESEGAAVRAVDDGAPEVPGFEIISRLGTGASGGVWLAEEVDPGRTVALKILHRYGTGVAGGEILRRELRILAKLIHPNLVLLYHSIMTAEGQPGLAMEWIDGWPLDEWLEGHPDLTLTEKLELFRGMVRGVAFLHDHGVIHRDLKPANVMVDTHGVARLVDFGLARLHQEETAAGRDGGSIGVTGTLHFMAPEQAADGKGSRAMPVDVYALGVMLYRILTGKWLRSPQATPAETLAQVLQPPPLNLTGTGPPLPADLRSIIRQALAPDPARRYHHARELEADLIRFAAKQPVAARKHTLFYLTSTFLRRQARRSALAGALVLAGLGAGGSMYYQHRRVVERNETNLRHAYTLTSFTLEQLRDELRNAAPTGATEPEPVSLPPSPSDTPPVLPLNAQGEVDLRYYTALLADLRSAVSEGHKRYSAALPSIQRALDLYASLAMESPGNPRRLFDAAQARLSFARLLERTGRPAPAAEHAEKTLLQVARLAVWPGFDPAPLVPLRCDSLRLLARQAHQVGDAAGAIRYSREMLAACAALPPGLLVHAEQGMMPRHALGASDLVTHVLAAGPAQGREALPDVSQALAVCRAAQVLQPKSLLLKCGLGHCLHAMARLKRAVLPEQDHGPLLEEAASLLLELPSNMDDPALQVVWEVSGTATERAIALINHPDPALPERALNLAHRLTTHLRRRGEARDEVILQQAGIYLQQSRIASRMGNRSLAARFSYRSCNLLRPRQVLFPDRFSLALLTAGALHHARTLADQPDTRWTEDTARHLNLLLKELKAAPDKLTPAQQQELSLLK